MNQNNRYQLAAELTNDYFFEVAFRDDGTAYLAWITEAFTRITGLPEDVSPKAFREIVHPDDLDSYDQRRVTLARGKNAISDYRIIHATTGKVRWLRGYAQPIMDDEGKLTAVIGAVQDVTQQKEYERALALNEHRWRTVTELLGDYAFSVQVDEDGTQHVEWITEAPFIAITGYQPEEVANRIIVHPDDADLYAERMRHIKQDGEAVTSEYRITRKDGALRWLRAYARPEVNDEGRVIRFIGGVQDITERKLAEQAEHDQRRLAEALHDSMLAITSTLDPDEVFDRILRNIVRVIPADTASIMLVEDGIAEMTYLHGFEGKQHEVAMGITLPIDTTPNLRQMKATHEPLIIPDVTAHPDWRPNPEISWIRGYMGAPIHVRGELIGFINLDSSEADFFTEEHARRLWAFTAQSAIAIQNARSYQHEQQRSKTLAEAVRIRTQELRHFMEHLEAILNSSPDVILMLSTGGVIETANPAFGRVFGSDLYPVNARMTLHDFAPPAHHVLLDQAISRVIRTHQIDRFEMVLHTRSNVDFDAEVAIAPIVEEGQAAGLVCTIRDISVLKQVARMKDAFISNVSHELRTPITSLKLYHNLLQRNPARLKEYLARVIRETDRLERIVEGILNLSVLDQRQISMDLEEVDINELVNELVTDRSALADTRNLTLAFDSTPDLPLLRLDVSLIMQAVSVLVSNAIAYTPAGGYIQVRTCQQMRDDGRHLVGVSVQDDGPGIPDEERDHVFERFFRGQRATDTGAAGTGLGLPLAAKIAEQHGGYISLIDPDDDTADQVGARFTLWLPVR